MRSGSPPHRAVTVRCSSLPEIRSPIGSVIVAALTRTRRGLVSELDLTSERDGVPSDCIVNFDNIHTLPREVFRGQVTTLAAARMAEACRVLAAATGC